MPELLNLYRGRVKKEWIDAYGHMNMAMYVLACDEATAAFWDHVNGGVAQAQRGGAEYVVVETHVNYLDELREGEPFRISSQLLSADSKRFRLFHCLVHEDKGITAATNEVMALGFDLGRRGLMNFHDTVQQRLQQAVAEHALLPTPEHAGRAIGMPRRRA